jgi:hypothetical protein
MDENLRGIRNVSRRNLYAKFYRYFFYKLIGKNVMHTLPCIFFKVYYSIVLRNPHIYELYLLVPDINITVPASEDYIWGYNYFSAYLIVVALQMLLR